MAKSKTRFNKPRTWAPHAPRVMAEDVAGGWVRLHDYNELLRAYRGALYQLDRAAKRVATMTLNAKLTGAAQLHHGRPVSKANGVERRVR